MSPRQEYTSSSVSAEPAGSIMLEIECHNCFLSFSKEDFSCSFPMRHCCHRHSMFKIKQGIKDLGRWCSRAGDGTEDQTAVGNSGNWERQKERGSMHTNAALWIPILLPLLCIGVFTSTFKFHYLPVMMPPTQYSVFHITSPLKHWWITKLRLFPFCAVNLSSGFPSKCLYLGVNLIEVSALHRSNLAIV